MTTGRRPLRPDDFLVGLDGPEGRVTARVAALIYRSMSSWERDQRDQGTPLDPDVSAFIEALRRLRLAHLADLEHLELRILASSAPGTEGGTRHVPPPGRLPLSGAMTAAAAAEFLGCSTRNVRALCVRGVLTADRVRNGWLIDPVSLVDYAARQANR